jgi:DNA-directed RNA polymerase beta' subunit
MERMLCSATPESLTRKALANLETRLYEFFAVLLTPSQLLFHSTVLFSGRAVLVPGADLRIDQVGIGEDMAWTLFGPLVMRELGDTEEVRIRGERATTTLDAIMARSWIIVYRSPALTPTAFLAFHPVRYADKVIRLHPLTCTLLNADFDGDQAAVFLPVTEAAQREAGERLSVAGHLQRDIALLRFLLPTNEAMWGLAYLSLSSEGRKEIGELLEIQGKLPDGLLTGTSLFDIMSNMLREQGVQQTLTILEQLTRRGFAVAKATGASLNPFIGARVQRPPEPRTEDFEQWRAYAEMLEERIASRTDYTSADSGPQLLAIKSEAIGSMRQFAMLVGSRGAVMNVRREYVPVYHGFSQGLTPGEMFALVPGTREALARLSLEWEQTEYATNERTDRKGFSVLARARRSSSPGIVFAHAAATGEVDPLTDVDSRLFVGVSVAEEM